MKRLISAILATFMMCFMLPVSAAESIYPWTSDGVYQYQNVVNSYIIIEGYNAEKGGKAPIIPDYIDNLPVLSIQAWAFMNKGLTSVTLPSILQWIGVQSFAGNNFTTITLPNTLYDIGADAFQGCPIIEIYIPDSVDTIDGHAFEDCRSLGTVRLPENNATEIKDYAFKNCVSLETIYIPKGVTTLHPDAFSGSGLKKITLLKNSFADTVSFNNCNAVKEYTGVILSYERNGGSFSSAPPEVLNLGESLPSGTKDGMNFKGWYTQNGSSTGDWGTKIDQLTSSNIGEIDTKLYAKFLSKIATPDPRIDYTNYMITGLSPNGNYTIGGTAKTADGSGNIAIDNNSWYGKSVSVIAKGDDKTTEDSSGYSLAIKAIPAAPTGFLVSHETGFEFNDGIISGLNSSVNYEIKPSGGSYQAISNKTLLTGLSPGTYYIRLAATANSFKSPDSDPIVIDRYIRSEEKTLSDLTIDGDTIDGFSSTTPEYNITVQYDTSSITVGGAVLDPKAKIKSGLGTHSLPVGDSEIEVFVEAEDPAYNLTYKINIHRQSGDATISELSVDGESVEEFNSATPIYSLVVPYDTESVTIGAATTHQKAEIISGDGETELTVGDNTIYLEVVAEDNDYTKTYTIEIRRQSGDASLLSLALDGASVSPTINRNSITYSANVPHEKENVNITAIPNDSNSSVSIVGAESLRVGENWIVITVTPEDTNYTKAYILTVTRQPNEENILRYSAPPPVSPPSPPASPTSDPTIKAKIKEDGSVNGRETADAVKKAAENAKAKGETSITLAIPEDAKGLSANTIQMLINAADGLEITLALTSIIDGEEVGSISLPINATTGQILTALAFDTKRTAQVKNYVAEKFKAEVLASFETAQKGGWGSEATLSIDLEKLDFEVENEMKLSAIIYDTKPKKWYKADAEIIDGKVVIKTKQSGLFTIVYSS